MRRELCRMKRKLEKFVELDDDARQALRPELDADIGRLHQLAVVAGIASPRTEHDTETLQAEIQKHLQEASSKDEELKQLKKVIESAGNNARARHEAEERLQSALDEQVAENKELLTRMVETKARLVYEQVDNDNRIAKLNREIQSLQKNSIINSMNHEVAQALQARLESRGSEIERLTLENHNLVAQYKTVQDHIEHLEKEMSDLIEVLRTSQESNEVLKSRYWVQEVERTLGEAHQELSTMPSPILQQKLNAYTSPKVQVMTSESKKNV